MLFDGRAGNHSLFINIIPNVLRDRIHCADGMGLDRGGRGEYGLHQTGITIGERILRKLQRTVPLQAVDW